MTGSSTQPTPAAAVPDYVGSDMAWAAVRALCHDLRQPLAAILIVCSSLASPDVDGGTRRALGQIQDQAGMLVEMVRQVVGETSGLAPTVVGALVERAVRAAELTSSARLEYHGPADGVSDIALVDAARLHRAVANLVDNAVRAAGAGGLVRVRVSMNPEVEVVVEDDGPGFGSIPRGTGLGLVIVRDVATELGGTFDFRSSVLGGAFARLRFPVVRSTPLVSLS
jgi:signal transduction histidine kinase